MDRENYLDLVDQYKDSIDEFGNLPQALGWTSKEQAERRYKVMLELVHQFDRGKPRTLLDLGCGTAHMLGYMLENKIDYLHYSGLDPSPAVLDLAKAKYPDVTFYDIDVLKNSSGLPKFDYIVMNGVTTYKDTLSHEYFFLVYKDLLRVLAKHARLGFAFNVMSTHVDREREDLFHLPMDTTAGFLCREISRNFVIRHDYGRNFEYTTYVYL